MGPYLKVHAAQSPTPLVKREVSLDNRRAQPMISKLFLAPDTRKKPTLIVDQFRLDDESAFERSFDKGHFGHYRKMEVMSSSAPHSGAENGGEKSWPATTREASYG